MIRSFNEHAANERTFLSWVRTGVTVIGFGLVIERFDLLAPAGAFSGAVTASRAVPFSGLLSRYNGLAIIFFGLAIIAIQTVRFVRTTRMLDDAASYPASNVRAELIFSAILVLLVASFTAYVALT
ncbi:YidH family protein [Rhodoplanes sp. Z2-YC6860]|uniref:YidH family protein n=1 Tax=Rhodoplanes sp. Z2-YC6860 TaxID=674703 RepID=UPI00078E8AD5|nr:DUF202 domain-containing protein [Rhodoplanes sp. Z2-YC6860]AMN44684.1 hypothetical protein RHPLAN_62730 [Rhodoplanes sp. Z2-YC6860]